LTDYLHFEMLPTPGTMDISIAASAAQAKVNKPEINNMDNKFFHFLFCENLNFLDVSIINFS